MTANTDNTHDTNSLQDVKTTMPVWHRPVVSKVSIEMTLIDNGSIIDSWDGSSPG